MHIFFYHLGRRRADLRQFGHFSKALKFHCKMLMCTQCAYSYCDHESQAHAGRPHSVVLDHTSLGPGATAIDFTWSLNVGGGSSIFVQSDLSVEIVTP